MSLINSEINHALIGLANYIITDSTGAETFEIINTKLKVPAVTLSVQDNLKLLKKLKLGSWWTSNWNKKQQKVLTEAQNQYFNFLIDVSFQRFFK